MVTHSIWEDRINAIEVAEHIASAEISDVNGVYARIKNGSSYEYEAATSTIKTIDHDLNLAYLYLLSTFAGPNSPDIMVASKYNILAANENSEIGGKHSAPNWADQHILLILNGPGVLTAKSSSAPARLVDILPTIVSLMKLDSSKMDGIVLADSLKNPLSIAIQDQAESNASLAPMRDALKKYG